MTVFASIGNGVFRSMQQLWKWINKAKYPLLAILLSYGAYKSRPLIKSRGKVSEPIIIPIPTEPIWPIIQQDTITPTVIIPRIEPDTLVYITQEMRDSVIKKEQERVYSLVNPAEPQVTIKGKRWDLCIDTCKITEPLNEYRALSLSQILNQDWWQWYKRFITSSGPLLDEIIQYFWLDKLKTNEEKIKAVLALTQIKADRFLYSHDSVSIDGQVHIIDYTRKPALAWLNSILKNGSPTDCDDFASMVAAMLLRLWIPEKDIALIHAPWHRFLWLIGKKYIQQADHKNYYIMQDGTIVVPVETTYDAPMNIAFYSNNYRDTTYNRAPTIWLLNNSWAISGWWNQKILVHSKKYPQWAYANTYRKAETNNPKIKENNNGNTDVLASIEDSYGKAIVQAARNNLGSPYDTSPNGIDGGALDQYIRTGTCQVKDNLTGKITTTHKRPFVCTDLIIQALSEIGLKSKIPIRSSDPFDFRRITKIEEALKGSSDFLVQNYGFSIKYPDNTFPHNMGCKVGDIITISNNEGEDRHAGIITEVDINGNPLRVIHSSGHRGVVETPFFNSYSITDYRGHARYDGFLYKDAKINKIIRPNKNNMALVINNINF